MSDLQATTNYLKLHCSGSFTLDFGHLSYTPQVSTFRLKSGFPNLSQGYLIAILWYLATPILKVRVGYNLILEHVGLLNVLDLAVHLVNFFG